MIELSSEARKAYEVMVLSLEPTDQAELEEAANSDPSPDTTQPEEPEYSKLLCEYLVIGFFMKC